MSKISNKPDLIDGIKGFFLEIFYITYFEYCYRCNARFNGYYCKEYMEYCHHCGSELKEEKPFWME